ncbi:MAG: ATP-binding protein [Chloroflexi bacterium]|jgi:signal transduction histidine kinase|nr:ATP-binding protein [Chloroflexota bacterium]
MFSRLRLRLTLLYLLVALLLTALIDGGVYALLRYSFQASTDQALQRKVELGAQSLGLTAANATPQAVTSAGDSEEGEGTSAAFNLSGDEGEDRYDAELAPVFLVPLDAQGNLVSVTAGAAAPVAPDEGALKSATESGSDLRTLVELDGSRYRLLTTRVTTASGDVYLQAGRSLADQDAILRRSLFGMLAFSAVTTLLLGWGSWLLAGRSLVPAQAAWERQQAFVANASHELRAPLTLLRASAEVAGRKLPPDSPSRPLLDDVLRETDAMARLVEDLLLLSRLDAGALRLDIEPVDLVGVVRDVGAPFERVAEDRGIRLEVDTTPVIALGDRARLRQVLLILLDNALRYVPAGGWIRTSTAEANGQAVIAVSDNGAGIAPEHLPHVFDRFYRGDAQGSGGSGLGLSIARAVVRAMHGEIHLESRPGEGTRVTVRLPIAR